MGKIKKYSVDKVFDSMDIVEVIGDFVELKKSGAEYAGMSPVNEERTPSFKVHPVKDIWKDFSSGQGGKNAISFLIDIRGMSYREAIEHVANKYGIGIEYEDGTVIAARGNEPIIYPPKEPIQYSYHDKSLINEYGRGFKENNFVQFLKRHFPKLTIEGAILNYRLGTSTHIPGATIFWYVDNKEIVTYGKVIQYDRTTGSSKNPEGRVLGMSSMSYLLKLKDFNKRPNLFGGHLINNRSEYYGIVESEKTAVIMSMIDDRITWIASGGTSKLNLELLAPLANKNVILFPDAAGKNTDAHDKWKELAIKARGCGYMVTCSSSIPEMYDHLKKGYDLADHYLKGHRASDEEPDKPTERLSTILSPDEIICKKLNEKNGAFESLVSEFGLTLENGHEARFKQV